MKTATLFTVLITFCFVFFQSCSKDEHTIEKSVESTIDIKDGMLCFESDAHFKSIFNNLMKNPSPEYLGKWESQFEGFTSMKTAYTNLNEGDFEKIAKSESIQGYENILYIRMENGEKEATMVTEHPVFARMFNKDGILVIADDAFKIEKDKLIKIANYDQDKIKKIISGQKIENLKILGIKNQVIENDGKNLRTEKILDLERSCHSLYNGDKYAFKAIFILIGTFSISANEDWTSPFSGLYNGIIAVSQHRKKSFGFWFAKQTGELRLSGQAARIDGNGVAQVYYIGPFTDYNTDEVAIIYGWGEDNRATASVTSSGIGTDNAEHGCTATRY